MPTATPDRTRATINTKTELSTPLLHSGRPPWDYVAEEAKTRRLVA